MAGKVAACLATEIRRGRFGPGDRLPSSRVLASQLGVHRNTVLSALDDLVAQGYVAAEAGRGVFVSTQLASATRPKTPSRRGGTSTPPADFPLAARRPAPLPSEFDSAPYPLLGGLPDLRLIPEKELARAYRSALRSARLTLDYQSERGQPRFLREFSRFLAHTRGVTAAEGELMATRGSQQALFLAAHVLCRPGQVIAVEALGYPPAWEAFRLAGAKLQPVRVDKRGIVVDDLLRLSEQEDIAAVYVTPHHQYPTTVTMSASRRQRLLELAQARQFFVIEDDYDHEFHFEGQPVLPLASFDAARLVIHIGTLSKVFAPGLRIGYVAAQERVVAQMAAARRLLDRQGDHTLELALAYLIEEGVLGAHLRRMHRVYAERRLALHQAISSSLQGRLSFVPAAGGLAVWARVVAPPGAGTRFAAQWAERALTKGVAVQPARMLSFDGRHRGAMRLGFPRLDAGEIRQAVRLLGQCYLD